MDSNIWFLGFYVLIMLYSVVRFIQMFKSKNKKNRNAAFFYLAIAGMGLFASIYAVLNLIE